MFLYGKKCKKNKFKIKTWHILKLYNTIALKNNNF